MILSLLLSLVPQASQPDVAILVLDDVSSFDLEEISTPNIDAMAASGVKFTRAYASAWCAPTRDAMLRSVWRTSYHGGLCGDASADPVIPWQAPFRTMPSVFAAHGYEAVLVGKWHLGLASECWPAETAPYPFGFSRWLWGVSSGGGCFGNQVVYDGVLGTKGGQETPRQRDEFLMALGQARGAGRPFFGMLCFTDAHSPYRVSNLDPTPPGFPRPDRKLFESEVRGLDVAVGEILEALGPDAWVFLVGDNGTPDEVSPLPGQSKLTVYERGVRVPLIASGPGMTPQVSHALVSVVDILPSLLDGLDWVEPFPMDGTSLVPAFLGQPIGRDWVVAENPTRPELAVIETRWKLMEREGAELFFDLDVDPLEKNPLPLEGPDYERLRALMDSL